MYTKRLHWQYASGCNHADSDTGYRERMPSICSLQVIGTVLWPWRYCWQNGMLAMCISLTYGYLKLHTEAVCALALRDTTSSFLKQQLHLLCPDIVV